MAIHRGVQSAIFYYMSCAPCADARYRRKRKEEAKRDRADRARLEASFPSLYRHPSPSSTNPHWQAEIEMGPTLVRGKRKTTPTSENQRAPKPSVTQRGGSGVPSSIDLPRGASRNSGDGAADGKARRTPQQREDEELWGVDTPSDGELPLRVHLDGSTSSTLLARPERARTKDASSYQSYRNPPINDRHPPTVTRVQSKQEVAWMMQPPPVADVMSGKRPPPRSRSDSGGSKLSSPSFVSMSRQSSSHPADRRLYSAESLQVPRMSRENSSGTTGDAAGRRHDRMSPGTTTEEKDFAALTSKRTKRRPSPIKVAQASEDSETTVIRRPSQGSDTVPPRIFGRPSRPPLSTIISDSLVPSEQDLEFYTPAETPKENSFPGLREDSSLDGRDRIERRSAVIVQDSSFKALSNLTPTSTFLNTRFFATTPAYTEAKVRLPPPKADEAQRRSDGDGGGPEMFDSWYTPDFQLDKWIHENTRRDGVHQRWSMDI
ncbi:hypothetical protein M433DRAFT_394132 [Acidomyces richmondensis BFW]|nr:MAG: hypothetical protein FE78DRAFT_374605 [Acidomyces sp. 'richmondensis']KYG42732.1 hypothetical protein M433DRAFT_394132 [Acidomyces richmondensis BFW]